MLIRLGDRLLYDRWWWRLGDGQARSGGLLPTGARNTCFSAISSGLFDLSGNAREFTSPRAANVNPLRGGAYGNLAEGTECLFNWSVVDNNFAFVNTGFRCCFTGASPP